MAARQAMRRKRKCNSSVVLFLAFVFVVFTIFPTPIQNSNRPDKQLGLVESWTPRTRTRTDGKLAISRYEQRKLRQRPYILSMSSSYISDNFGSTSYATTADTILKQQKPLEHRTAAILEFVDNTILDPSSSKEIGSILQRVQCQHRDDFDTAKASYLEVEDRDTGILRSPLMFENISYAPPPEGEAQTNDTNRILAIRSTEPVLDLASVHAVKEAAEDVWKADEGDDASTSRFTYQYSGNSEAHVFDFITTDKNGATSAGKRAVSALNEALQRKIYPTIRDAFFQTTSSNGNHEDNGTRLFVYDSLVIRYNSTEAAEAAESSGAIFASSAGQPLHRDLGLISVNIMLNSPEDFDGGGTFFENQLLGVQTTATTIQPLKPSGVGYCLAHSASERHAGAGTTTGVRDILVLFVSAAITLEGEFLLSSNEAIEAPAEILSARLKNCRTVCERTTLEDHPMESEQQWLEYQKSSLLCRIIHQRLAVTAGPKGSSRESLLSSLPKAYCDGEALQYLGTALMEYATLASNKDEAICVLEVASECMEVASLVTPCDSRVYNNLGIILGNIDELERNRRLNNSNDDDGGDTALGRRIVKQESAYRRGLAILRRSIRAGCTNESLTRDLESLSLNYGLCVANQDRFRDAAEILEPVAKNPSTNAGQDAHRLWKYCIERCSDGHVQEPTL